MIYTNFTQRNVMDEIGVMHDKENICFTIRTKDIISDPLGAGSWMKLYLNTEGGMGYQYVLNNSTRKDGTTTLACVKEAGECLEAIDVPNLILKYEIRGDVMQIKVPRKGLGLDHDDFTLWFKVADSREEYVKIEDFYDKGDVAPLGRLNFVYRGK